jgi:predicted DNA-binding protein with PD1-like motif
VRQEVSSGENRVQTVVRRLKPNQELFAEIESLCQAENIEAGVILSLVGSVKRAALRFANQENATEIEGHHEIVSVTGTVSKTGCHIHISVADDKGTTTGGHLLPGAIVYTTIELVILDMSKSCSFKRSHCELSGFEELVVVEKN